MAANGDALHWLPKGRVPNGCQRGRAPLAAKGARPQWLPTGTRSTGCQRGRAPLAAKGDAPLWQVTRAILACMEDALKEIIAAIKAGERKLDAAWLERLVRRHNRAAHDAARTVAKRRLLPYYLDIRKNKPELWATWDIDPTTEETLLRLLKMKPRRTASGVATITVLTKPWPCSSDCLYCPNDVRCPKSYLADEPACQRAERNFFDPYLQVKSRLYVLEQMGHVTDKVELIVLGGTWSDYPESYQRWYIRELFRALNDGSSYRGGPELADLATTKWEAAGDSVVGRTRFYADCGLAFEANELAAQATDLQASVNAGELSYNQAIAQVLSSSAWEAVSRIQDATWDEVEDEQRLNENAAHRCVGLVIETRPDLITNNSARTMRRFGCTKIQMGIQSLNDSILAANHRHTNQAQIANAFAVLRAFGFKTHVHFMVNLLGSDPEADKADYLRLVTDTRFCPDEVKLYPCALVESSHLMDAYESGAWRPYTEEELLDVLVADTLATPDYTRISRMIRDISATDIVAGNLKTNLRQMVEARLGARAAEVREIRMREIAGSDVTPSDLRLCTITYETATTEEHFLQWVTEEGRIAGFCRLSLPYEEVARPSPTAPGTAMIREVHVYGRVAGLGTSTTGAAQHAGLGKALIEEACHQAREAGYARIAVISAVGTRQYYRGLGFEDEGLYQVRKL